MSEKDLNSEDIDLSMEDILGEAFNNDDDDGIIPVSEVVSRPSNKKEPPFPSSGLNPYFRIQSFTQGHFSALVLYSPYPLNIVTTDLGPF